MDEIIFRSSQKLENLQIQLSLAAQHSRFLLQQYSEKGVTWANQAWHSPRMTKVQDAAKELLLLILEVIDKGKEAIFKIADPRKVTDRMLRLFRNELTRQQICCGCIGFILGAVLGYSVANFIPRSVTFLVPMKAVACTNYQGIQCATLMEDIPTPKIEEPNDLLVQVKASSISLIDADICMGYGKRLRKLLSKYNHSSKSEFPIILGRSCSGVVLEIGQGVTRFEIGDEVYLTTPYWSQGTISELFVAKEFRVAHKPKRTGFESAAGLAYAGSLALNAISTAEINWQDANQYRILVCEASTPVGCVLIQFCHMSGANITTTCSVRAAPAAKALGADDIIVIHDQTNTKLDLETKKSKILRKELELRDLFDVIFITREIDESKEDLVKFCKPNGKIVSTLTDYLPSDHCGMFLGVMFWTYVRTKCLLQSMFGWEHCNFGEPTLNYSQLDILADLVDNKNLQSVVDKVFHLDDIDQAFDHIQSRNSIGSTIITFR